MLTFELSDPQTRQQPEGFLPTGLAGQPGVQHAARSLTH